MTRNMFPETTWLPSPWSQLHDGKDLGRSCVKDCVEPYDAITGVLKGCVICIVSCICGHFLGVDLRLFCPTVCLLASFYTLSPLVPLWHEWGRSVVLVLFLGAWGSWAGCETPSLLSLLHPVVANSWDPWSFPGLWKTLLFLQQFEILAHFT